ncbi:hypothetical protein [Terrabacter sp. BE26]|uniref:hypothetical protein n=1 Tax=Terrabacter sp. BE26 TaxID=2898152 RepID=UPI0035BE1791
MRGRRSRVEMVAATVPASRDTTATTATWAPLAAAVDPTANSTSGPTSARATTAAAAYAPIAVRRDDERRAPPTSARTGTATTNVPTSSPATTASRLRRQPDATPSTRTVRTASSIESHTPVMAPPPKPRPGRHV